MLGAMRGRQGLLRPHPASRERLDGLSGDLATYPRRPTNQAARELRPVVERVYWSAVSSLADHPDELVDEAVYALTAATSACPEILARLAEDDLLDPEARQGADLPDTAAESE